ncbi:MAG TPA: hypothetical protein PLV85_23900, partial [Polyangiaceae bacterium]|nr:hypothetical protein [Polyangiaceae bacterium]
FMRIETKIGLVSTCIILIAAACGGRSGPEIWAIGEDAAPTGGWGGGIVDGSPLGGQGGATGGSGGASGSSGAGGTGEGGTAGSTGGTSGSGGVTPDADVPDVSIDAPQDASSDAKDFFDSIPGWNCVTCLEQRCKDKINACFNDPTCVSGVQCTVTQCLAGGGNGGAGGGSAGGGGSGGGVDMACVLNCFDNDYGSAMTAVTMFMCITQSCGDECMGQGGMGGAGGGSGSSLNGLGLPSGLFGYRDYPAPYRRHYIGTVRVPRPEEVAGSHPWLAELLSGRMPDPAPPCIVNQREKAR